MMFHFNLHHITLILIGYLSNVSCSPLPFGLLSLQVSGNGITFSQCGIAPLVKIAESRDIVQFDTCYGGSTVV